MRTAPWIGAAASLLTLACGGGRSVDPRDAVSEQTGGDAGEPPPQETGSDTKADVADLKPSGEVGPGCLPATPPGKPVALAPWKLVRLSADGEYTAVSNSTGTVEIVPVAGGAPVKLADNALASDFVWVFRAPTGAAFAAMDGIDAGTSLGTLKLWTPTTGVTTIPGGVLFPRFSPDGKYMGWLDRSAKPYAGYLLEIGAAAPTMVAADAGSVTFSFSADSKWIVGSHGVPAKVWAAPTATGALVDLTDGSSPLPARDSKGVFYFKDYDAATKSYTLAWKALSAPPGPGKDLAKAVAGTRSAVPGSDRIVFTRGLDADGRGEMAAASASSASVTTLVGSGVSYVFGILDDGWGVLYATTLMPGGAMTSDLNLLPLTGGAVRKLADANQYFDFGWSTDGKYLVFSDPSDELYVGTVKVAVTRDATAPVATVTPMGGFVRFLDGHRLLHVGEFAAEHGRLALYDADTGVSTDIHGSASLWPDTSADGKAIAYTVSACGAADGVYVFEP